MSLNTIHRGTYQFVIGSATDFLPRVNALPKPKTNPSPRAIMLPFAVRERLAHIERCLFWKGELQRADITDRFGVNPAQAATDFSTYMALAPGNMAYDKSRKRYVPSEAFAPRFVTPTSVDEFVGMAAPVVPLESWPLPLRHALSETFQAIVGAVRDGEALEVRYQSMTTPKPTWRWLSPHAFASDGERWHVRAFCHERGEFRDFVLGRILTTRKTRSTDVTPEQDLDWHTFVTVSVTPNPALSEAQRTAIAAEYNLPRSQEAKLKMRRSMLFYLKAKFSPQPAAMAAAHQLVVTELDRPARR